MVIGFEKFLTKESYKYVMFGYLNALRYNLPTITIDKSIRNFMKYHGLDDDTFNSDSARVTYYRMLKEYTEMQKEQNKA